MGKLAKGVGGTEVAEPEQENKFTVTGVSDSSVQSKKQSKSGELQIRKEAWFNKFFSHSAADVIYQRRYPSRKLGFHCASCGIPGSTSLVIKVKEGGNDYPVLNDNNEPTGVFFKGAEVGKTCLTKYGGVTLEELAAKA